jgi:hypothetical protein
MVKEPVSISQPPTGREPQMFWYKAGQGSVLLTGREVEQFGEMVRELLKDDTTFNNFAVKELEELLRTLILNILKVSEDQRTTEIEKQIAQLNNRLKADVKKWTFVVPIANLTLERKQLRVGNVKLFTFADSHVKQWKSMFHRSAPIQTSKARTRYSAEIRNNILVPLKKSVCAEITVEGRFERAYELALQEVRNAVHVIMMFFVGDEDFYRSYFGVKGEIVARDSPDSRRNILFALPEGLPGYQTEMAGPRYPLDLDKTRVDWMVKNGLGRVSALFAKKETNSFEDRLKTAIYWTGAAMNVQISSATEEVDAKIALARKQNDMKKKQFKDFEYHDFAERLIKLMVALESLVILDDREPIVSNLGERTAFLVGKNLDDRMSVDSQVKKLYRLRSRVIHHGRTEITHAELDWLSNVLQCAILRLIQHKDRMGVSNDKEFRDWFVKNKFS